MILVSNPCGEKIEDGKHDFRILCEWYCIKFLGKKLRLLRDAERNQWWI